MAPLDAHFGDGLAIRGYSARRGRLPGQVAVRLLWDAPASETLRFSVQALDRDGKVLAGIDRHPDGWPVADGYEDRVGLAVGTDDYTLLLRVYDSTDGAVLLPTGAPDIQGDHVLLTLQDGEG
jgi:hypothetical protein